MAIDSPADADASATDGDGTNERSATRRGEHGTTADRATASPPVAVRWANVTHEYGDTTSRFRAAATRTVTALRDVSLEIHAGEVIGLVGPSGSGKSTALHVMGGLLVPTDGRVEVLGTDLTALSTTERTRLRRDRIGFVFQGFHLLPALSARANVALPLVEHGIARRERRRRADEWLDRVGLGDRASHRPSELSGGEQQRVAIARALVTDPDLVLADEPTGELDTETGERVLESLVDVADDRTVVLATHDERAVERAARTITLLDGAIVDDG
ncbi:ABC transporter ATP-binding protein [Natrialbaceae archaeon GCM10025810]|uniref:ABC transporter ATP-binding protein n=1 Tax=Halovalidus salilacus TaxID=3075124 RepID=UPI003620B6E6